MSSSHRGRPPSSSSATAAPTVKGGANSPAAGPSTSRPSSASGPGHAPSHADFTPVARLSSGMFAGKCMRNAAQIMSDFSFWLEVAQEPVHGRRKTEKDRRPLAPSPIVRLWIREHRNLTAPGFLIDPTDVEVSHLVCAAELGPARQLVSMTTTRRSTTTKESSSSHSGRRRTPSPSRARESHSNSEPVTKESPIDHLSPSRPFSSSTAGGGTVSGGGSGPDSPSETFRQDMMPPAAPAGPPPPRPHSRMSKLSEASGELSDSESGTGVAVAAGPGGSRPTSRGSDVSRGGRSGSGRGARSTGGSRIVAGRNFYGNLHVAGIRVPAKEGGIGLWFLFTDLCIRNEGSYSLHFRCFDMTAIDQDSDPMPPLAQGHSADFKVYSPRNFPGLPKPTELTEHFARQGYKLNTRKNERQAASPPTSPPLPPGGPST